MFTAPSSYLIAISRPRFYSYLFGPFIVGLAAGAASLQQLQSPLLLLLLFFFVFPANLFLYGINDLFDGDTDQFNPKKKKHEHLLRASEHQLLRKVLAAIIVFTLILSYFLPLVAAGLFLLFLLLGAFYSAPPFRFKARPFFDAYSNILYVLPGFLGYYLVTNQLPSIPVVIACWSWAVGMHVFSAVPDIAPDKKAGITTTAVLLGKEKSLLFIGLHWTIFSIICLQFIGLWGVMSLIYPAIIVHILFNKSVSLQRVYWWFPYINTAFGFLAFWYFFLPLLI